MHYSQHSTHNKPSATLILPLHQQNPKTEPRRSPSGAQRATIASTAWALTPFTMQQCTLKPPTWRDPGSACRRRHVREHSLRYSNVHLQDAKTLQFIEPHGWMQVSPLSFSGQNHSGANPASHPSRSCNSPACTGWWGSLSHWCDIKQPMLLRCSDRWTLDSRCDSPQFNINETLVRDFCTSRQQDLPSCVAVISGWMDHFQSSKEYPRILSQHIFRNFEQFSIAIFLETRPYCPKNTEPTATRP